MSETTPLKVFCSHASPDKPVVKRFAERLRTERRIDAWVDEWEIAPGDNIVTRINEGLKASDAGLIFFSRHTADSRWVTEEIGSLIYRRVNDSRPLIPVMIDDDAPVPELIRPLHRRGITEFEVYPEEAGLPLHPFEDILGGTPAQNGAAFRALLDGAPGAYRDAVLLNSAAALVVAGQAADLREGAARAATSIDSGAAAKCLETLAQITSETS